MDLHSRVIEGWHSPSLGQDMPIVSYGHWGHPILLFPTAAADFLEHVLLKLGWAVTELVSLLLIVERPARPLAAGSGLESGRCGARTAPRCRRIGRVAAVGSRAPAPES